MKVFALTAKQAALVFFTKAPCRNTIIVRAGWFKEEFFSCDEMIKDIQGVDLEDIPLVVRKKDPPRKIGLIEDFMNHVILGEFQSWN